jgi:hypothetical protein
MRSRRRHQHDHDGREQSATPHCASGGHLTGDGPEFISKMLGERLIRQPSENYDD